MNYYLDSEEAKKLAASRAATQMSKGVSEDLMYDILIDLGHAPLQAKEIIFRALKLIKKRKRIYNWMTIVSGILCCAIGAAGTSFNYYLTSPGHHYLVITGIVLVGAWWTIVGIYKTIVFEIQLVAKRI